MQTLREYVHNHVNIDDAEWEMLNISIKVHHYKKGDVIDFKDNIWTDFIYINSGMFRSYIINEDGKDFTRQFHFNTKESLIGNLFATDLSSLLKQTPSLRGFEALEDTEVLIFSKQHLNALFNTSQKWNQIGRVITEQSYISMDTYYFSLLTQKYKRPLLTFTKRDGRTHKNYTSVSYSHIFRCYTCNLI